MRLNGEECWARLREADHGVLCTSSAQDTIDPVPVCFVVVEARIATPIDLVKPKETTRLERLRNVERDDSATLLCEHWDRADWSQLWWVRARLTRLAPTRTEDDDAEAPLGAEAEARLRAEAEVALRAKYRQYAGAAFAEVLLFEVTGTTGWSAAGQPR